MIEDYQIDQFYPISSFIVVAQPTGSDGTAVTQYTKNGSGHSARLTTRIICLLDPDILKEYIELSDIGMNSHFESSTIC